MTAFDVAKRTAGFSWRGALAGAVLGVDAIGHCVALATLCFAGPLVNGLGLATASFLAATALVTLVLVAASAFPNAIGIAQDTSIAVLAPAAALAACLGELAAHPERLPGMAAQAAATSQAWFSREVLRKQLRGLLDGLIGRSGPT